MEGSDTRASDPQLFETGVSTFVPVDPATGADAGPSVWPRSARGRVLEEDARGWLVESLNPAVSAPQFYPRFAWRRVAT
jgi:hypothetical protein